MNRNINDLHPIMRQPVRDLEGTLLDRELLGTEKAAGFRLFEGYREPDRQDRLFDQHPRVTKARAWQSAHQYGLAVDYVWWTGSAWSWADEHPWADLRNIAMVDHNLVCPLRWDRPHIEHRAFALMKARLRG